MAETVGLLSVVTLKDPSVRHRAQCSSRKTSKRRGHFPLCWPTLLNPASVNKISTGAHYDQHTNKAITFQRRDNNEIKDMVVGGKIFAHSPHVAKQRVHSFLA